jgi:hypothetical protein
MPKSKKHSLNTLFRRIGEVAVTWAYLEMMLDLCIIVIYDKWEGAKAEPERPRTSFARKTEFLRKWYTGDQRWPVVFPGFEAHITLLENAAEHRHRLIHGVAINIGEYPHTGTATVIRTLRKKNTTLREEASYTLVGIRNFRTHAFGLAVFMGSFAEILSGDPVLENDPDNSIRALSVKIGGLFPRPKHRRDLARKRR